MEKSAYRVRFFKTLEDSTGHSHECCQGEVEVQADDDPGAIVMARRRFAELAHIADWSLRADYETVQCLPTRKRASGAAPRAARASLGSAVTHRHGEASPRR